MKNFIVAYKLENFAEMTIWDACLSKNCFKITTWTNCFRPLYLCLLGAYTLEIELSSYQFVTLELISSYESSCFSRGHSYLGKFMESFFFLDFEIWGFSCSLNGSTCDQFFYAYALFCKFSH